MLLRTPRWQRDSRPTEADVQADIADLPDPASKAGVLAALVAAGRVRSTGAPAPTPAPTITSANPSGSFAEGQPVSGTLTADQAVTWGKTGADAALVTLDTATGVWSLPETDYETKTSYAWSFTAANANGSATPQAVTIAISDVDDTAPALNSASDDASGQNGALLAVTTNEGNGTLYAFISTSASPPSATALKNGTGAVVHATQPVNASGVQQVPIATGLTAGTTYYAHFLHRDAAGNDSAILSGDGFTTDVATPSPTFSVTNATSVEGTPLIHTVTVNRNGLTGVLSGSWTVTGGNGANPVNAADFGGAFQSGTWTIADGSNTTQIGVTSAGDADFEPDETYRLGITYNGVEVAVGTGTITNDDEAPEPIAATYYVSSTGNDTADGTSEATAWQTANRAWQHYKNDAVENEAILFEGGQTFDCTDTLWAEWAPAQFTFGSYGTGRATLRRTVAETFASGFISLYNCSNFVFHDLIFDANGMNTRAVLLNGSVDMSGFWFLNCDFINALQDGLLFGQDSADSVLSDIFVSGGTARNNGRNGIMSYSSEGGYDQRDARQIASVTIDGVTAHGNGAAGIVLSGARDSSIERCPAYDNGALIGGGGGVYIYDCTRTYIRYCEAHENKTPDAVDGLGFDIDGGCYRCAIEYCYSHDNAGAGFLMCTYSDAPTSDCEIRHCISVNDDLNDKAIYGGLMAFTHSTAPITNSRFYNNTVINTNGAANPIGGEMNNTASSVTFANNLLVTTGGKQVRITGSGAAGATFGMNQHFGAGTFQRGSTTYPDFATFQAALSPTSINSDPQLPQTAPLALTSYDADALAAAYSPGVSYLGVDPTTFGGTQPDTDAFGSQMQSPPVIGAGSAPVPAPPATLLVQGLPEDFDSARADPAAEVYTDLGSGNARLRIGRTLDTTSEPNGRTAVFGRFRIAAGANLVTFEHDYSDTALGYPGGTNTGLVWRNLGERGNEWKLLSSKSRSGNVLSGTYDASARTGDHTIEVASQPVFQYADLEAYIATLATRTHVYEAPSAIAATNLPAFVHTQQSVPAPGSRLSSNTYNIATTNQYAVRITNTDDVPGNGKRSIVLICMQHATEYQGDYAWVAAVDWLTVVKTDPAEEAVRQDLLRDFEVLLYNVNPNGRVTGAERGVEEANFDGDPNRTWVDPEIPMEGYTQASVQVGAVMQAVLTDTDNMATSYAMLDYHGASSLSSSTWTDAQIFYEDVDPLADDFLARFQTKGFTQTPRPRTGGTPTPTAQTWFRQKVYLEQPGHGVISSTNEFARGGPGYPNVTYDVPAKAVWEVFHDMAEIVPAAEPIDPATLTRVFDYTAKSGAAEDSWQDSSGNARHLTRAAGTLAASHVVLDPNGFGTGLPAMVSDGVIGSAHLTATFNLPDIVTVFCVVERGFTNAATDFENRSLLRGRNAAGRRYAIEGLAAYVDPELNDVRAMIGGSTGQALAAGQFPAGLKTILVASFNASGAKSLQVGDNPAVTASGAGALTATAFELFGIGTTGSNKQGAKIARVFAVEGVPTDDVIAGLKAYLTDEWFPSGGSADAYQLEDGSDTLATETGDELIQEDA